MKTPWYTACRLAQERWKATTASLPDGARAPGQTWVEGSGGPKLVGPYPICLPLEHAPRNLLPAVRDDALARFDRHGIAWHHGTPGQDGTPWPSTHLLDSQVQCVNTLLTLTGQTDRGLSFAREVVPDAVALAEIEDGSTVAFEWVGLDDHLGERRGRRAERGRFTTSADALLVAERADGGRTAIVVEWKFTESYDAPVPFRGRRIDRREVYRARYETPGSPFRARPPIEAFFHEPHYQLLRLVLLAEAMAEAGELGVDHAVVVHAVPSGNEAMLATVPDGLRPFGASVPEVWGALVGGGRVGWRWVDTPPLFGAMVELFERYGGLA